MKKTEIPTNHPENLNPKSDHKNGQKTQTNTREEIKAQQTDRVNPNNGPLKKE